MNLKIYEKLMVNQDKKEIDSEKTQALAKTRLKNSKRWYSREFDQITLFVLGFEPALLRILELILFS